MKNMAYFNYSLNVGLCFCNLVAKVQYSGFDVIFFEGKMLIKSSVCEKNPQIQLFSREELCLDVINSDPPISLDYMYCLFYQASLAIVLAVARRVSATLQNSQITLILN